MPVSELELSSLAASYDIIALGARADEVRRSLHGARTTFVRVADVDAAAGSAVVFPHAAGEVRIVGVPPTAPAAIDRVREVLAAAGGTPVSAFSLSDLEILSNAEGVRLRSLLESLHDAGLELVAEARVDQLQEARRAIEDVNIAGLTLARLTIDRLTSRDPLAMLREVADLHRAVGVIRAFAPLPRRVNPAAPTTGYEDIKRVALARLVVDGVPSIQVDWRLYGPKLAQVALTVGADDVDSVSAEDAGAEGRRRGPLEEIRRNIRAAGFEPVERNGRFDAIAA